MAHHAARDNSKGKVRTGSTHPQPYTRAELIDLLHQSGTIEIFAFPHLDVISAAGTKPGFVYWGGQLPEVGRDLVWKNEIHGWLAAVRSHLDEIDYAYRVDLGSGQPDDLHYMVPLGPGSEKGAKPPGGQSIDGVLVYLPADGHPEELAAVPRMALEWAATERTRGHSSEDIVAALRTAMTRAAGSLEWSSSVGDRLDTSVVSAGLGITRQALANRRRSGSLIALEGERTSWWPVWQFSKSGDGLEVRPVVARIVTAFRDALGDDATEFLIASWATSPNVALDGQAPAAWVSNGGALDRVVEAATEDATAEAR